MSTEAESIPLEHDDKVFSEHPTLVAYGLGVPGVELDTVVELEVDEFGYLIIKVTDERLDHPFSEPQKRA